MTPAARIAAVIEILTEIGFESEDEVREFGVFRCLEG